MSAKSKDEEPNINMKNNFENNFAQAPTPRRRATRSRTIVEKKSLRNYFAIGHSEIDSETFVPTFQKDEASGLLYVDIPGLNDTGGSTMEIMNRLMLRNILSRAKTVRFIVPITFAQIHNNRGFTLRE